MLQDNEIIRIEKTNSGEEGLTADQLNNFLPQTILYKSATEYAPVTGTYANIGPAIIIPKGTFKKDTLLHFSFYAYVQNATIYLRLLIMNNTHSVSVNIGNINGAAKSHTEILYGSDYSNSNKVCGIIQSASPTMDVGIFNDTLNPSVENTIQLQAYLSAADFSATIFGLTLARECLYNSL